LSSEPGRVATRIFIWVVVVSTVVLTVLVLPFLPYPDPTAVGVCLILSIALERFYLLQPQGQGSVITPSLAPIFAAMWLTGPAGALLCAVFAAVASQIFRRRYNLAQLALNAASVALAAIASGAVSIGLGMHPWQALGYDSLLATFCTLVIYFAVNTFIVGTVIGIETGNSWPETWRRHFVWLTPQYLSMGLVGAVGAAAYQAMGVPGLVGYSIPFLAVYYTLRLYVHKAESDVRAVRELNSKLEVTNEQLIEALAAIVDARDALLYGHSAQVALYATKIAQEMGLEGEALDRVRKAALLHDVGKVAVPEDLLFKPDGLNPKEYERVQHHAIVGEQLVALVDALEPLSVLVGQHHEAWDGTGYPLGLAGDSIELGARIINLCDSLDTILSDRPYKRGYSLEWAVDEVERCRGTQFDPDVVDAFRRVLAREGEGLFVNSAHATAVGLRRSELFDVLRRLGVNVRARPAPRTEAS